LQGPYWDLLDDDGAHEEFKTRYACMVRRMRYVIAYYLVICQSHYLMLVSQI